MKQVPWVFRDYAMYLIPGFVYWAIIYYLFPKSVGDMYFELKKLEISEFLFLLIFFSSSYILGFFSYAIFSYPWRLIIRSIPSGKDPIAPFIRLNENKENAFGRAIRQLKQEVGADATATELIYYAQRFVMHSSPTLGVLGEKITSIDNLTKNLCPPVIILFCFSVYQQNWEILFSCALFVYSMTKLNIRYREWLCRVVLNSYLAIHNASEL